jgi:hypothetical protein
MIERWFYFPFDFDYFLSYHKATVIETHFVTLDTHIRDICEITFQAEQTHRQCSPSFLIGDYRHQLNG